MKTFPINNYVLFANEHAFTAKLSTGKNIFYTFRCASQRPSLGLENEIRTNEKKKMKGKIKFN